MAKQRKNKRTKKDTTGDSADEVIGGKALPVVADYGVSSARKPSRIRGGMNTTRDAMSGKVPLLFGVDCVAYQGPELVLDPASTVALSYVLNPLAAGDDVKGFSTLTVAQSTMEADLARCHSFQPLQELGLGRAESFRRGSVYQEWDPSILATGDVTASLEAAPILAHTVTANLMPAFRHALDFLLPLDEAYHKAKTMGPAGNFGTAASRTMLQELYTVHRAHWVQYAVDLNIPLESRGTVSLGDLVHTWISEFFPPGLGSDVSGGRSHLPVLTTMGASLGWRNWAVGLASDMDGNQRLVYPIDGLHSKNATRTGMQFEHSPSITVAQTLGNTLINIVGGIQSDVDGTGTDASWCARIVDMLDSYNTACSAEGWFYTNVGAQVRGTPADQPSFALPTRENMMALSGVTTLADMVKTTAQLEANIIAGTPLVLPALWTLSPIDILSLSRQFGPRLMVRASETVNTAGRLSSIESSAISDLPLNSYTFTGKAGFGPSFISHLNDLANIDRRWVMQANPKKLEQVMHAGPIQRQLAIDFNGVAATSGALTVEQDAWTTKHLPAIDNISAGTGDVATRAARIMSRYFGSNPLNLTGRESSTLIDLVAPIISEKELDRLLTYNWSGVLKQEKDIVLPRGISDATHVYASGYGPDGANSLVIELLRRWAGYKHHETKFSHPHTDILNTIDLDNANRAEGALVCLNPIEGSVTSSSVAQGLAGIPDAGSTNPFTFATSGGEAMVQEVLDTVVGLVRADTDTLSLFPTFKAVDDVQANLPLLPPPAFVASNMAADDVGAAAGAATVMPGSFVAIGNVGVDLVGSAVTHTQMNHQKGGHRMKDFTQFGSANVNQPVLHGIGGNLATGIHTDILGTGIVRSQHQYIGAMTNGHATDQGTGITFDYDGQITDSAGALAMVTRPMVWWQTFGAANHADDMLSNFGPTPALNKVPIFAFDGAGTGLRVMTPWKSIMMAHGKALRTGEVQSVGALYKQVAAGGLTQISVVKAQLRLVYRDVTGESGSYSNGFPEEINWRTYGSIGGDMDPSTWPRGTALSELVVWNEVIGGQEDGDPSHIYTDGAGALGGQGMRLHVRNGLMGSALTAYVAKDYSETDLGVSIFSSIERAGNEIADHTGSWEIYSDILENDLFGQGGSGSGIPVADLRWTVINKEGSTAGNKMIIPNRAHWATWGPEFYHHEAFVSWKLGMNKYNWLEPPRANVPYFGDLTNPAMGFEFAQVATGHISAPDHIRFSEMFRNPLTTPETSQVRVQRVAGITHDLTKAEQVQWPAIMSEMGKLVQGPWSVEAIRAIQIGRNIRS